MIKQLNTLPEDQFLKNKRHWVFALLTILLLSVIMKPASGQTSDFATWTKLRISTKIVSNLEFELTQEFRLENNSSQFDEIFTNLSLAYSPFKFLELAGSYRYLQHRRKSGEWIVLHRFHFDLNLKAEIKRFEPEYRLRYVSYPKFANENKTGIFVIRHKVELYYDIRNFKLNPYISSELFHAFEDDGNNEIVQVRYTVGAKYRLNKYHRVGAFFRYEQEYNIKNPDTTYILGLSYRWNLKFNEKKKDELKDS